MTQDGGFNKMSYYDNSQPPKEESPMKVYTSSNSTHVKRKKKSKGCGCGKKRIITEN